MFAALMPTVLTFPTEIKVFLNEHRNGWYSTCSYYWAKTITELLIQLPLPYFYCLFMYWSTKQFGLNQLDEALPWSTVPSRFREFAFICVMASFIAQGKWIIWAAVNCVFATASIRTNRIAIPRHGLSDRSTVHHKLQYLHLRGYNRDAVSISFFFPYFSPLLTTHRCLHRFNFLFSGFFVKIKVAFRPACSFGAILNEN